MVFHEFSKYCQHCYPDLRDYEEYDEYEYVVLFTVKKMNYDIHCTALLNTGTVPFLMIFIAVCFFSFFRFLHLWDLVGCSAVTNETEI